MFELTQKIKTTSTLAFAAVMLLAVAATVPASATATSTKQTAAKSGEQVVYLTKIKPGTNAACAKGKVKKFTVTMRVPKGEKIRSTGPFSLHLQSGTDLTGESKRINSRTVVYRLQPKARTAKVSTTLAASYAYAELTDGASANAVVSKTCEQK